LRLYFIYGDEFAERVAGNLVNYSTFCQACELACEHCRLTYPSHASDIYGLLETPRNLPTIVENPEEYLPRNMPNCDLILAVGIHHDLLLALPSIMAKMKAKGVIVPVEAPHWCPPGLRRQLEEKLDEARLEYAFPKPFCALEPCGKPAIDSFIERYAVGKPLVEVEVDRANGVISGTRVVRSAPCGSTWYVAQQLKRCRLSRVEEVVSKAHHSFPCTASMQVDPEFNDTILHKSGYIIREAVKDGIRRAPAYNLQSSR